MKGEAPLSIVLDEVESKAGSLEGEALNTIDSPDTCKAGWAFDDGEEETEVVALACDRSGKVHPTNGHGVSNAPGPLLGLLVPGELLRELLVGVVAGLRDSAVGNKELSEGGFGIGTTFDDIGGNLSGIPVHQVLT